MVRTDLLEVLEDVAEPIDLGDLVPVFRDARFSRGKEMGSIEVDGCDCGTEVRLREPEVVMQGQRFR